MTQTETEFHGVSRSHQDAAEEVREHLVALRGGAPFLSGSDAQLLVEWLDADVGVPSILRALERAADARRKRKSRVPLRLGHAKKHLGKATKGHFSGSEPEPAEGHPLQPLVDRLRQRAADDSRGPALEAMATQLAELDGAAVDGMVRTALSLMRRFFADSWVALSDEERDRILAAAATDLVDLRELVDESSFLASCEELARDGLRQAYPELCAATLWDLVGGDA
jgi:hypothetical protein